MVRLLTSTSPSTLPSTPGTQHDAQVSSLPRRRERGSASEDNARNTRTTRHDRPNRRIPKRLPRERRATVGDGLAETTNTTHTDFVWYRPSSPRRWPIKRYHIYSITRSFSHIVPFEPVINGYGRSMYWTVLGSLRGPAWHWPGLFWHDLELVGLWYLQ